MFARCGGPYILLSPVCLVLGAAARLERNALLERVSKASMLAPVMGMLLGMWQDGSAQQQFVEGLAEASDARLMDGLKFMKVSNL